MQTVHFFRRYRRFKGGHLKVWDYFNHVVSSPSFTPTIEFSPDSVWDHTNPWRAATEYVVDSPSGSPDIFFLAGSDWLRMDRHPCARDGVPVVNLLQHVRHADPKSDRFQFLTRKAIRICVSERVAEAVSATGLPRGPLLVIPCGLDLELLPPAGESDRHIGVLVAASKRPDLGRELALRLERLGRHVELLEDHLPRREFLARLRGAQITVFLPNEAEGWYLPALEGMASGTLVVCPRFMGDPPSYCHGRNCIRADYTIDDLARAAEAALDLQPGEARQMRASARQTAEWHSLARERESFLEVLHTVDQLW